MLCYAPVWILTAHATPEKGHTKVRTHISSDESLAERATRIGIASGDTVLIDKDSELEIISEPQAFVDHSSMLLTACGYVDGRLLRTNRGKVCSCPNLVSVRDKLERRG